MYKQKILIKAVFVTVLMVGVVSPVFADGDSVILKRIELLEQQLRDLKKQVADQNQQNIVSIKEIKSHKAESNSQKSSVGKIAGFDVKIGGYVKVDAMWSNWEDGEFGVGQVLGRQYYVPSTIPVNGDGESTDMDIQATESRINFSATRDIDGHNLTFFTEMDFFNSEQGNEVVSNSYSPRLRHFFLKYDNWLFGQTWSTFQDVAALSENLDFIGPAEGTVFVRQPQVRWTNGALELAIENPETRVWSSDPTYRVSRTDDGWLPDVVARYTFRGNWGHFALAGMYRNLSWDNGNNEYSENGFGISTSGKIKIGSNGDDLRFMFTAGSGVGRYLAVSAAWDTVYNPRTNEIEAIDTLGGFVSYRHLWNDKWRSNLTYSRFEADNDVSLTGTGVSKNVHSLHANLIYSPTKKTDFGIELMRAEREIENGDEGAMTRLIFSAKYAF